MKKIWYDPAQENYAVFRTGRACWVATSPDRPYDETFAERPISASTYCGLFHFGIVDRLEHLPSELGPIGSHEEGVLLPAGLAEAAQILRAAAGELQQDRSDTKVATQTEPDRLEYWMTIDLGALRTALLDLADFVEAGARQGYAVQLWL
jgi:hypothetical protein